MARKKKKVITDPCDLPDDQFEEWLADDSGRRGWRAVNYWDIRHKSMTPPEVQRVLAETAGVAVDDMDRFDATLFEDYGFVGFFTQDTAIALEVIDCGCDFLFDKASGIWFIDLFGRHQIVMGALDKLYNGETPTIARFKEDADRYIEQGRGFFNSGAASYGPPTVRMSEDYVLPAELKTFFKRQGFEIWRM